MTKESIIALLASNDILLIFSWQCLQDSGPKTGEIAKFIDKVNFTGKISFYR